MLLVWFLIFGSGLKSLIQKKTRKSGSKVNSPFFLNSSPFSTIMFLQESVDEGEEEAISITETMD